MNIKRKIPKHALVWSLIGLAFVSVFGLITKADQKRRLKELYDSYEEEN